MDNRSLYGYRHDSPYRNSPFIDIETPEGLIDMSSTPHDILGVTPDGEVQYMKSGRKSPYRFGSDIVREIPMKQMGGYSQRDIYQMLFEDDDEEIQDTPEVSAPTEEDIQEENVQTEDTSQYDLAMQIAMEEQAPRRQFVASSDSEVVPTTSFTPLPSNSNAQFAFEHYKKKGLPDHAAAGIVGNLMHESGLNPYAKGDGGKATGVAQWHPDRFKGLQSWAQRTGRNPYSLEAQLDFVLEEPGEGPRVLNTLKTTRTAEEAAVLFSKTYERPGIPAYKNRIGYAKGLLK